MLLARRLSLEKEECMKFVGLFLMPAGFFLAVASVVLFPDPAPRLAFIVCGLAVEALGLGVAVRGHMANRDEGRA